MYNVLQIHITNMVCAISLRSIKLHFSYFDSFLILFNIQSNDLVNVEQVRMVLVRSVCFVSWLTLTVTYLIHLLLITKVQLLKMLSCAMISSTVRLVFATLLYWSLESIVGKGCNTGWRTWLVDVAWNTGAPVLDAFILSIHKSGTLNWLNP